MNDQRLDVAVELMSTSISKICDQAKSKQLEQSAFKFQEFHNSMNEIFAQLPVIEATRLQLDCMERANAALERFAPKGMDQ